MMHRIIWKTIDSFLKAGQSFVIFLYLDLTVHQFFKIYRILWLFLNQFFKHAFSFLKFAPVEIMHCKLGILSVGHYGKRNSEKHKKQQSSSGLSDFHLENIFLVVIRVKKIQNLFLKSEIGRASCRERVCREVFE